MSVAPTQRSLRVVMFPDLLSTDPYSDLLDDALRRRGVEVERGGVLDRRWARAAVRDVDAVHLHWLEFLFYSSGSRLRRFLSMYAQGLRVISALRVLRASDVQVIWTVHNPSPHESGYPRLHRLLRSAVLRVTDAVVVHSHYSGDRVKESLRVAAPVWVVPHGGYVGVYPPPRESRAQTRERLGLPADVFVYLIFGHVREYKRVPEAIRAFRSLPDADTRLLVAGEAGPPREATEAAALGDERVLLNLRSLPEQEVAELFQAVDVVVLNYAEVFSSGALLLAQAFGLPVVAPVAGSAVELAPPPATIPFAEGELPAALAAARRDHPERRRAARAAAGANSWDESARILEHLYRRGRSAPQPCPTGTQTTGGRHALPQRPRQSPSTQSALPGRRARTTRTSATIHMSPAAPDVSAVAHASPREAVPLTVIVPTYNRAYELQRALASVVAQSPAPAAEVIVVDDGSDEDIAQVAEALGARVLRHSLNRGLSAARNTGVEVASHEWVAFLDSDDEWLPHHLATLWPLRDGHVVVAGSAVACRDDPLQDRIVGPLTRRPRQLHDPAELVHPQNCIAVSASIAQRAQIIEVGGFRAHEAVAEDLDMWLRLLEHGTAVLSPWVSVLYHSHSEQMSYDRKGMRDGHRALITAFSGSSWWRPQLLRRWEGVEAWDAFRDALELSQWPHAARQACRIAARPARVRGVADVLKWRLRARRGTSRVTRRGTPSLAVAVRDEQLRAQVVAEQNPREVLDMRFGSLVTGFARLLRRPTGVMLVDSALTALMARCLGIRPFDVRYAQWRGQSGLPPTAGNFLGHVG